MRTSKSSSSSSASDQDRLPSPIFSGFEYVGRLVTRERLTGRHSDLEDFSKPIGVARINDRHVREIYRVPTPPPEIKRVFHRLRSPKPKIIERVFVRRPAPEIIENIIEIPPEEVRVIDREKQLRPAKPIIRTKVVYLKPPHQHRTQNQQTTTFNYQSQLNNYIQPIHLQPTCYTYDHPSILPNYPQY